MKLAVSLLAAFAFLGKWGANAEEESVLTERVLNLSVVSAKLSELAYENATKLATFDANGTITGYSHPDYESIKFFTSEPDQAIVAKTDDRCYIGFRGTEKTVYPTGDKILTVGSMMPIRTMTRRQENFVKFAEVFLTFFEPTSWWMHVKPFWSV